VNKILKSFVAIITILFLLVSICPTSLAETDFAEQIDSEERKHVRENNSTECWVELHKQYLTYVLLKQWVLALKIMTN
jgi:hypothetical protein